VRLAVLALFVLALCGCGAIGEGRHRVQGAHIPNAKAGDQWMNPAYCVVSAACR
jgi:hypothetical protein